MFSRVRHRTSILPEKVGWTRTLQHTKEDITGFCPSPGTTRTDEILNSEVVFRVTDDTISDMGHAGPHRSFGITQRNPRVPRPCKPVLHTKLVAIPRLESTYIERSKTTTGLCLDTTLYLEETTPAAWLCERFGYQSVLDFIQDSMPNTSLFTFSRPDWFSVVDEFKESIDSLINERFFSGEFLAESGIFGDALRLVLNPKKGLQHFFRHVVDSGLKHKTLGEIDKSFRHSIYGRKLLESRSVRSGFEAIPASLKDAVSAHLFYKFGVAPAIQDIRSAMDVHSKVQKRFEFLVKNEGQYVPIRVRRTLPVAFDSSYPTTPYVGMASRQSAQRTEVTLFAQGRVRGGLNEASGFRAYAEYFGLNKVVGTAWELIPFTFVLDWFTNAQERINDLTRIRLGEGTFYNLVGLGTSVKDIVERQVIITPGYDQVFQMPITSTDSPIVAYDLISSVYNRVPGIPDTSGVVDLSTLGLFQGVTGTELLIQKLV